MLQNTQQNMYSKGEKERLARLADKKAVIADSRAAQVQLVTKGLPVNNVLKDDANYRAERELGLSHFRHLLSIFQQAAIGRKDGAISFTEFQTHFSKVFEGTEQEELEHLFMRIDSDANGTINWNEFSTFMLLRAEGEANMQEQAENSLFEIDPSMLHRLPLITPHKDLIGTILWLDHFRKFVTVGRDGMFCFWSDRMKLQRFIKHENRVFKDLRNRGKRVERWINDTKFLENMCKLVVASDDHFISFHGIIV